MVHLSVEVVSTGCGPFVVHVPVMLMALNRGERMREFNNRTLSIRCIHPTATPILLIYTNRPCATWITRPPTWTRIDVVS